MPHFESSRLKIKRTEKHLDDIDSLVMSFTRSDSFHSASIEYDKRQRTNHLRFDIHTSRFPGIMFITDRLSLLKSKSPSSNFVRC